jgi:hypothetical protein
VEDGPILALHGVVRWRLIDLAQWLFEEFRSSRRSTITTVAPSAAKRFDVASPRPLAAPVTMAIRPSSLPMSIFSFSLFRDRGITRRRAGAAVRTAGPLGPWRSNLGRARPGGIRQFSTSAVRRRTIRGSTAPSLGRVIQPLLIRRGTRSGMPRTPPPDLA